MSNCSKGSPTCNCLDIDRTQPISKADRTYRAVETIMTGLPSGEVRVTDPETGGAKGQKPERYSLIPVEALAEVARVYEYGSRKYDDHNWRKGYAWSLSYDALQRHINAFWRGESYDLESGLHHLAHATFHLFTLMHFDGISLDSDSQDAIDRFARYLKKDDRP